MVLCIALIDYQYTATRAVIFTGNEKNPDLGLVIVTIMDYNGQKTLDAFGWNELNSLLDRCKQWPMGKALNRHV